MEVGGSSQDEQDKREETCYRMKDEDRRECSSSADWNIEIRRLIGSNC